MSAFNYRALDNGGKVITGVLEADTDRHARTQLRARNLKPLTVQGIAANDGGAHAGVLWFRVGVPWFRTGKKLGRKDLALLTRQLASLIRSGLPVDEALGLAARQSRRESVRTLLAQVRARVLEGRALAQALAEHPRAFDGMFQTMVRAGESSGFLGEVLERLADYAESSRVTRQRLQMAMIYPLALLGVSVAVVGLLMTFVVPKLVNLFAHSSRELPALTQVLIAVSDFTASPWALITLALFVLGWAGFRRWLRHEPNRHAWHRLLLRLPGLRDILVESDCARFAATLAILLNSGVPLLEALRIAAHVPDNLVLRAAGEQVALAVQEGSSLSKALDGAKVFPPLLVQMAASGEANGTLGEQLGHGARHQERELEMLLAGAMALLEPLTVVLMGGLVALIMLAVLLPIFDINKLV